MCQLQRNFMLPARSRKVLLLEKKEGKMRTNSYFSAVLRISDFEICKNVDLDHFKKTIKQILLHLANNIDKIL